MEEVILFFSAFFNFLLRSDETLSICDLQFSLLSAVIPRHLELNIYSIISPFKPIGCRGPVKFVLKIIIISVLYGWIDRLFLHHLLTWLTKFCRMQATSSTVFPTAVLTLLCYLQTSLLMCFRSRDMSLQSL